MFIYNKERNEAENVMKNIITLKTISTIRKFAFILFVNKLLMKENKPQNKPTLLGILICSILLQKEYAILDSNQTKENKNGIEIAVTVHKSKNFLLMNEERR